MVHSTTVESQIEQGDFPWRLQFVLNGQELEIAIDPTHTLLQILRDELGLTGTKGACLQGECGSCTILVDG
ncbi:MAG: 2Fe-2S iron-sulfur cluster binding domain-containing protein, partial [Cyanobacteria bacterium NC_groundwater_1444_Ag_S-0.65um_54_12]|nr:2Fe-2S iron-sulfur cluster binding domain-containing protein [Cyanobacteria bacterium NC_groundwater_1444_Ag_S-0.65um_54_12]